MKIVTILLPFLLALAAGCGGEEANQVAANAAPAAPASPPSPAPAETAARHIGPDTALLPPEAAVVDGSSGSGERQVLFNSAQPPARVLAWYRGARAFALGSEMREGAEHVLTGTLRRTREVVTIRLAPGENGGTAAMLLITAR